MPLFVPKIEEILTHIEQKELGITTAMGLEFDPVGSGFSAFERTTVDGLLKGFDPQITIVTAIGGLMITAKNILTSIPTQWPGMIADGIITPVQNLLAMLANWMPPSMDSIISLLTAPLQDNGMLNFKAMGMDLEALKAKMPHLNFGLGLAPGKVFPDIDLFTSLGLPTISLPSIPLPSINLPSMPSFPSIGLPDSVFGGIKMALGVIQMPLKILEGLLDTVMSILSNIVNPAKIPTALGLIASLPAKFIPNMSMLQGLIAPIVPGINPSTLTALVGAIFAAIMHLVGDVIGIDPSSSEAQDEIASMQETATAAQDALNRSTSSQSGGST